MKTANKNLFLRLTIALLFTSLCSPCIMAQKEKTNSRMENGKSGQKAGTNGNSKKNGNNNRRNDNPKPPKQPEIELSYYDISFGANGGSRYVEVTKDKGKYNVKSDRSWCKIENEKSDGFHFTCEKNPTTETRSATITVTHKMNNNIYKKIHINQNGQVYELKVENNSYNFPVDGGEHTFNVSTNDGDFYIENTNNEWYNYKKTSGGFTVQCHPNYGDSRNATITVKTNNKRITVSISQNARSPKAEIRNIQTHCKEKENIMTVTCDVDYYNMKGKRVRGVVYFYDTDGNPLKSNIPNYETTNGNLCKSSDSYTPQYDFAKNKIEMSIPFQYIDPTGLGKTVELILYIYDESNNDSKTIGKSKEKLLANIPLVPHIECDGNFNLSHKSGEASYRVNASNIDYKDCEVTYQSDWFTVNKNATGFILNYEKNTTDYPRSGKVFISYNNTPPKEFTVNQYYKQNNKVSLKVRCALGFDLAASANYNMKRIGSKDNSELFYNWGGGMLFRVTFGTYYNEYVSVSTGARYMKYSYNYKTTKGDLGDYVVFPVNLKHQPQQKLQILSWRGL